MKQVQKQLESIARSIQALAQKVEAVQKQMGAAKPSGTRSKTGPAKRRTVKKTAAVKASGAAGSGTAYALLLKTIEDSENGISASDLKVKTGFNDKKIANLIYKAKKQGKIKTIAKGVYSKS
jgi:hypothetical protein